MINSQVISTGNHCKLCRGQGVKGVGGEGKEFFWGALDNQAAVALGVPLVPRPARLPWPVESRAMIGENWLLVTNEPVEFEK